MLVYSFIAFVSSASSAEKKDLNNDAEIDNSISNIVEECIRKTTLSGIAYNSLQGGYFNVPDPKIEYRPINVPIYAMEGKFFLPDINIIEKELGVSFDNNINSCFQLYTDKLKENKISINLLSPSKIEINKNDYVEVSLSLKIVKEYSNISESKSINYKVPSRYYKHYELIKSFMELLKQNPNAIPFKLMAEFANSNNITIEYEESPEDFKKIIYVVKKSDQPNHPLGPFIYAFAVQYDW